MTVRQTIRQHQKQVVAGLGGVSGLALVVSAFWVDFDQSDDIADLKYNMALQSIEREANRAKIEDIHRDLITVEAACSTYESVSRSVNEKFNLLYRFHSPESG